LEKFYQEERKPRPSPLSFWGPRRNSYSLFVL